MKKTVGARLTPTLESKLQELCTVARRRPSAVVRALIAGATPASLPKAWVAGSEEDQMLLAEVEGHGR